MLLHALQVANPDPDPDLLFPRDLARACAYYCRYPVTSNSFLKKLVRCQHSFLRHKRITYIGQNYVTHLQQLLFVS